MKKMMMVALMLASQASQAADPFASIDADEITAVEACAQDNDSYPQCKTAKYDFMASAFARMPRHNPELAIRAWRCITLPGINESEYGRCVAAVSKVMGYEWGNGQ